MIVKQLNNLLISVYYDQSLLELVMSKASSVRSSYLLLKINLRDQHNSIVNLHSK